MIVAPAKGRNMIGIIHVNPTYEKHLEIIPDLLSTRGLYCEDFTAEETL